MPASTYLPGDRDVNPLSNRLTNGCAGNHWQRWLVKVGVHLMAIAIPFTFPLSAAALSSYLRPGDSGSEVIELQQILRRVGYAVGVDGVFGEETSRAVRNFQISRGLFVDGVVGEDTLKALNAAAGNGTDETIGFPGSDNSGDFDNGDLIGDGGSRNRRYVVIIPTGNAARFSLAQRCLYNAIERTSPLGEYIRVGAYPNRNRAETIARELQQRGCIDAHVRYF